MEPGHITGRVIGEHARQNLENLAGANIGNEIMYSFIIIACSLMIYFGTKELYELSRHRGIKYFRLSFLFFALAYFFRSFIKFFMGPFGITKTIGMTPGSANLIMGQLTLFLFMYFSSMAIFYLLYSVMHKKWSSKSKIIYLFHALAIIIAISIVALRNPAVYLAINIVLLAFITFTFYKSKKQKNKKTKNSLHLIYTLMVIFWIINILDILVPNFLQTFQIIIYISSLSTFLAMLYKVLRRVGSN